ncbi:basic proline-rich protein-like [Pongo pygmaeus]|uniref:basic proline-rich protein-like n=1 Tax=Pongo pygmaeus TaxID=9600 RepID=UPI00300D7EC4
MARWRWKPRVETRHPLGSARGRAGVPSGTVPRKNKVSGSGGAGGSRAAAVCAPRAGTPLGSGSPTRRDPTGGPHPTPLGASPGSGAGRGPSPRGSHQARPGPRGGIGLRGRTGTRRARARAAAAASGPRAAAAATALSLHRPRRPPPRARPLAPPRPEPPPGPRRRRRPPSALCLPLAAVPAFVYPLPRLRAPGSAAPRGPRARRPRVPARRLPIPTAAGVGKRRWQGQDGRAALRIPRGGDEFRLRRLRSRDTGRSQPDSGITGLGLGHSLPQFPPDGLARRRRRPHPRPELWGLRDPPGVPRAAESSRRQGPPRPFAAHEAGGGVWAHGPHQARPRGCGEEPARGPGGPTSPRRLCNPATGWGSRYAWFPEHPSPEAPRPQAFLGRNSVGSNGGHPSNKRTSFLTWEPRPRKLR